MPRILIIGLVAGLFGGLMWGGFHNLFTVPVIERAIVFEEEHSSALNPNAPEKEPLVPLGAQRVGMVIGTGFFGAVWGIVFAAGYTVIRRLAPDWKPLAIVVAVAALGYWAVSLFPFIRYPLNPPGVGEEGTVVLRQGLQLMFMVLSVIGVGVLLYGLREINQRFQHTGNRLRMYGVAVVAYAAFAVVMFMTHPANPDPVPVPIDLLELFRTLTMVGQFLAWAFMALGATAVMYWYKRRDEKAGNRFDPVTGDPINL